MIHSTLHTYPVYRVHYYNSWSQAIHQTCMTILRLLIDSYFGNKGICIKCRHSRSIFNNQLNCYIMFSVFLWGLNMAKFTMNKKWPCLGPLKIVMAYSKTITGQRILTYSSSIFENIFWINYNIPINMLETALNKNNFIHETRGNVTKLYFAPYIYIHTENI